MIESVFAWMLLCVTRTAFGRDVVPEVNMRTASAPGSTGTVRGPVGLPARPEGLVGEHREAVAEGRGEPAHDPPIREDGRTPDDAPHCGGHRPR